VVGFSVCVFLRKDVSASVHCRVMVVARCRLLVTFLVQLRTLYTCYEVDHSITPVIAGELFTSSSFVGH
jgi:hypothetical protein